MIDEPYRWLEAIGNRRDYVREQLKDGSPVFAACLPDGILVVGVGAGQSKVFELFDRHAMAGLGHPADLEKIRQASIDLAHVEAFTRAPEDVSLRRLVGFGLSPQLKTSFEQVHSAPYLVEVLMLEVGPALGTDVLMRLHFDGSFEINHSGIVVAASDPGIEKAAQDWLTNQARFMTRRESAADVLLQCWWTVQNGHTFDDKPPGEADRRRGWRAAMEGRTAEMAWLSRQSTRRNRYEALTLTSLAL